MFAKNLQIYGGEISARRNFLAAKFPRGEISGGEFSRGEISGHRFFYVSNSYLFLSNISLIAFFLFSQVGESEVCSSERLCVSLI